MSISQKLFTASDLKPTRRGDPCTVKQRTSITEYSAVTHVTSSQTVTFQSNCDVPVKLWRSSSLLSGDTNGWPLSGRERPLYYASVDKQTVALLLCFCRLTIKWSHARVCLYLLLSVPRMVSYQCFSFTSCSSTAVLCVWHAVGLGQVLGCHQ